MAFHLGVALGGSVAGLQKGWELGTTMVNAFNDRAAVEAGNTAAENARAQREANDIAISDTQALAARMQVPVEQVQAALGDNWQSLSREELQTRLNQIGRTNTAPAQLQGGAQPVLQGGLPLRAPVTREDLPAARPNPMNGKPGAAPARGFAGEEGPVEPGSVKGHESANMPPAVDPGTKPLARGEIAGGQEPGGGLPGGPPAVPAQDRALRQQQGAAATLFGIPRRGTTGGVPDPRATAPQPTLQGDNIRDLPPSVDKSGGTAGTVAKQVEEDMAASQRQGARLTGGDKPVDEAGKFGIGAAPQPGQPAAAAPAQGQPQQGQRDYYRVLNTSEVGSTGIGIDTDRRNSRSSAMGPFQFTQPTWERYVQANPDRFRGMSPEQALARRSSFEESRNAAQWLANENARVLRGNNLPVNDATVALGAFLGGGGASAVLRASPGTTVEQALLQGGIRESTVRQMTTAHPEFKRMTVDAITADHERRFGTGTTFAGGPAADAPSRTVAAPNGGQTVAPPDAPAAEQNRWTVVMGRDGSLRLREGASSHIDDREYDVIRTRAQAMELARRGDPRWQDMAERAQTMRTALRTEQAEDIQRGIMRAAVGGMDGLTRFLRDHHLISDGVTPQMSSQQGPDGSIIHTLSYGGLSFRGQTAGEIGMQMAIMMGRNPEMVFRQLDHVMARGFDRDRLQEAIRGGRVREAQTDRELTLRERTAANTERRLDRQDTRQDEELGLRRAAEERQTRVADETIRRERRRGDREDAVQALQDELQELLRVPAYERSDQQQERARQIAQELGVRNPSVIRQGRINPNTGEEGPAMNPYLQQVEQGRPTLTPNAGSVNSTMQQLEADPSPQNIAAARSQWQRNFRNGAAMFDQMVAPRLQQLQQRRPPARGGQGLGAVRPGAVDTVPNPLR